jgi:hypothetical protein
MYRELTSPTRWSRWCCDRQAPRPGGVRTGARGDARVHRRARRRHARRDLAAAAPAGVHPRPGRQARAPAAEPGEHPAGAHRPRRPDHLSRPRPAGGLPAARPAAAQAQGARAGAPDGAGDHRHPGRLRPRRTTQGWRAWGLHRRRQDRRARPARPQRLQLPRPGDQRGRRPRALRLDQPLRLRGAEDDPHEGFRHRCQRGRGRRAPARPPAGPAAAHRHRRCGGSAAGGCRGARAGP